MTHFAHLQPRVPNLAPPRQGRFLIDLVRLPLTWWSRALFRDRLREMLEGPGYLFDDVGFDFWDAREEAARRFWQPVAMASTSLPALPGGAP